MHIATPPAANSDHEVTRDYAIRTRDGAVVKVRVSVDFYELAQQLGRNAHSNKTLRAGACSGAVVVTRTDILQASPAPEGSAS